MDTGGKISVVRFLYSLVAIVTYVDKKVNWWYYSYSNKGHEMKGKSTPMRIDEATRRVINMMAGEYQSQTGKNVSANDALWKFLEEHRPDLTGRVEADLGKRQPVDTDEE